MNNYCFLFVAFNNKVKWIFRSVADVKANKHNKINPETLNNVVALQLALSSCGKGSASVTVMAKHYFAHLKTSAA